MPLTEAELETIRYFASTGAKRELAVTVYVRHIAEHINSDRNKCPEMEFMSEILSPCPDLAYRTMLRRKILELED